MRHVILIAGATALAISAPVLAESPTTLHSGFEPDAGAAFVTRPTTEVAQAQIPAYPPPAPTIVIAPTAPPALPREASPPQSQPQSITHNWLLGADSGSQGHRGSLGQNRRSALSEQHGHSTFARFAWRLRA